MKRVGILTSGGDCQALNATMRGVAKGLYNIFDEVEIYGFKDGYKGLMYGDYKKMEESDFSGILTKGGTILGTSRQPFKLMRQPTEDGLDKVKAMKDTYKKLKLDCLVVLGGNGSQKTANLLREEGLNVIGLPKTIDNDIWGTDHTFGFSSAVNIATRAIDEIHTTAESHHRIFVVEIMGHKVGWIALYAGIAGGADVILIPEIPYKIENVIKCLKKRHKKGKSFSIIAVAEGAISKELADLPKKERKLRLSQSPYPSIGYEIADQVQKAMGAEVRVTVPGHVQRGGIPSASDRILASRVGAKGAELIKEEQYGRLVVQLGSEVTSIPMEESAGKLKTISPNDNHVKQAKTLGISFGD